jgi:hypothetical protein
MKKGFWKTKEGKLIKISEMDNNHLINSAKMLARKGYDWEKIFLKELKKRNIDVSEIESEEDIFFWEKSLDDDFFD